MPLLVSKRTTQREATTTEVAERGAKPPTRRENRSSGRRLAGPKVGNETVDLAAQGLGLPGQLLGGAEHLG